MQLTTLITLTSATVASAKCFSGGYTWGPDKTNAIDFMFNAFCKGPGLGAYKPGQSKHACYQLTADKKVDFTIRNFSPNGHTMSNENCWTYLRPEIAGCEHGGSSAYTKFEYTPLSNKA
ncbi:hypothetical protein N0V88_002578 [Collariella sp. IMI 366227]|nr:hypothetical protein N0V88_002578 [Collariella sp. IMI 366227]